MLDVYRNLYHFTGEPFRLGPDYRFSLHHSSYASAKAYLEYAIFQGEGFVTITGGPGTGKTTLISEILSVVDKHKIEVSTLTSTQVESRDLLHMVAHSFGIESDDTSKANLLLEIESFLTEKIRNGRRAILIVDEAQGLSEGALEELRLLANLQYKYQLLLQIVLVGQERLLELIQRPAMEHLRQRMVAAASLEPLDLDETVNYIEHRLSRVDWKGDPSIDEGALRLVYRYSGGIPRRINLLMNRLFLYGGMDEKHQYVTNDVEEVVKGLVEEFLLPAESLIKEVDVENRKTGSDTEKRPRCLPREPLKKRDKKPDSKPEKPGQPEVRRDETADAGGSSEKHEKVSGSSGQKTDGTSDILSPRTSDGRRHTTGKAVSDMDVGSARRNKNQPPSQEVKAAGSTDNRRQSHAAEPAVASTKRHADSRADEPARKKGGKGPFLIVLLFAVAGSVYLLQDKQPSPDKKIAVVTEMDGDSKVPGIDSGGKKQSDDVQVQVPDSPASESGQIDRNEGIDTAGPESYETIALADSTALETAKNADTKDAAEDVSAKEAAAEKAAAEKAAAEKAAAEKAAAEKAAAAKAAAAKAAAEKAAAEKAAAKKAAAEKAAAEKAAAEKAAAEKEASRIQLAKSAVPGVPREPTRLPTVTATSQTLSGDRVEARRSQLRKDAEQRFNKKQVDSGAKATDPSKQASVSVATRSATPEKKPPLSASKVKQVLMQGQWSSAGKPASLLPSASTTCREQSGGLACSSVPQNVKTQYGLALYKVETRLSEFSPEGHFELAYRTLVRLVEGNASKSPAGDDAGWQITEYSMSCTLTGNNSVSCLDGMGITREYRRMLP